MKRRYSMGRYRFRGFMSKSMRRLGKSPDDGKMTAGDWVVVVATIVAMFGTEDITESIPYNEEIAYIAGSLLFFLGIFLKYRRLAPRPCWSRATWATMLVAAIWSGLPWILYMSGDMTIEDARYISLCSLVMWIACLGCWLRLRYIRRRSREAIALMRMRANRRRVSY